MLPYWHHPTYSLGGLTLQTWGTFVALGILVATLMTYSQMKRHGFPAQHIWGLACGIVFAAFVGARLEHVFLYDWGYFRHHLADIPKVWQGGFSSYGGFVGGAIAGILYLRRHRYNFYRYADVLIAGFPLGWAIGRIGCFLIHDHPGTRTSFVLGVRYPDGVRHDLGLYESLNAFGLAILLLMLGKRLARKPGATLTVVLLWYGPVRFFLDFLRAYNGPIVDMRYFGLTPAQYGSIVLIGIGLFIVAKQFGADSLRRETSSDLARGHTI